MKNTLKAHIALFLANFFYGINYIIVKGLMPYYISAPALTFVRIIPTTVLFWLICSLIKTDKIEKKDFRQLLFAGFFGVFCNQYLFIQGLDYSTPIDAAIIMTTSPILVFIMSAMILKDSVSKIKMTGIIIGAAGALILILGKGFTGFKLQHLKGDIMLLLNSISFAVYLLITRPLMIKYNALTVLKWVFLIGAIFYFPFGIIPFSHIVWNNMSPKIILSIAYVVFATTFLTYLLINYSLKLLKSTVVSMYIYIQPVIAAIVATLIGIDKPTAINISACILVFVGVYLVSGVNKQIKSLYK